MHWLTELGHNLYRTFIEKDRYIAFLKGIGTTLEISFFAVLLGTAIGVIVAVVKHMAKKYRFLRPLEWLSDAYVLVIRGTPVYVQLLVLNTVVLASVQNKILVAVITFGVNSGAYVAEIIRGGLMSLDPGQMEAGRSLGLGYLPTMTFIVVPQAFKAILPALGNEFITLLKDTSLISAIAGKEVVYFAKAIGAKTYDYMFPLLIIAVMYLILVLIFTWLQGILERRLRASDRR